MLEGTGSVFARCLGAAAATALVVPVTAAHPAAPRVENAAYAAPPAAPTCKPGQILDLANWKLQLPTGASEKPSEILPASLTKEVSRPFFHSRPDCEAVVFRAPVNGVTTKGSNYPRSELREMTRDGKQASWSSGSGAHLLSVIGAFTALPKGKPEVVGAQIHDAADDVSVFRLEGSKLWVTRGDNPHFKLVTDQYKLGTVFNAAFVVTRNTVGAYYNGRLVTSFPSTFSGAYFKAGAYTQANCKNSPCRPDNYGETTVYDVAVAHVADPAGGKAWDAGDTTTNVMVPSRPTG